MTFTNEIDSLVHANGIVSDEKIAQFVKDIQDTIYTRTPKNAERIITLSSMSRYIDKQVELTTDSNKEALLNALKKRINSIIQGLRQDIADNVTVIPNHKKNNTSSDVISNIVGGTRVYRYVNTENILAVRSNPNFMSTTIGYLMMNEYIEILAGGLNWSHIKTGSTEGYVRTRLLRKTLELRNGGASLGYHPISHG